ncbi:hypothetical protein BH10BDE1_BH10BDE1_18480 [soil metagenome]
MRISFSDGIDKQSGSFCVLAQNARETCRIDTLALGISSMTAAYVFVLLSRWLGRQLAADLRKTTTEERTHPGFDITFGAESDSRKVVVETSHPAEETGRRPQETAGWPQETGRRPQETAGWPQVADSRAENNLSFEIKSGAPNSKTKPSGILGQTTARETCWSVRSRHPFKFLRPIFLGAESVRTSLRRFGSR